MGSLTEVVEAGPDEVVAAGGGESRRLGVGGKLRLTSDGSVDPRDLVMAFSFVVPQSSVRPGSPLVRVRAIDSGRQDAIVIDRDEVRP